MCDNHPEFVTHWLRALPAKFQFVLLCLSIGHIQWWAMLTIPLIALYNGQRGRHRLRWLFYLYYPAHLVILYAISYLL